MSIVRILKLDLKLFPYHIQVKHKLTTQDQRARVAMCNWFNDKMEEDEDWIDNVWFSDEAHLPSRWTCQFKELCILGNSTTTGSIATAFAQLKGYSLVCHEFKNHNWTLLV